MRHILLIGAWPELTAQLVGLPAKVSLIQLPDAADGWAAALPFRSVAVDYRDVDAAVAAAGEINRHDPIDVVIGLREFALPATVAIAKALRVPSVPGPVDSLGRNKADVRRLLADGGCHIVRHEVCTTAAEVADFAKRIAGPVIVKPLAGAGSIGVHALMSGDEAERAYAHARAATGRDGEVLAEELLAGPEFSVETFSVRGVHEVVAITEKQTTGPPHFVETGHVMPARLKPPAAEALATETIRALTAIGHTDGPSHVELIVTPAGPAIIEINRRIGGDRIWELLILACERNLMAETLRAAAGLPPRTHITAPSTRAAAIRYVAAEPTALGDALADVTGIIRSEPQTRGGQGPATSSLDRPGFLLAVADTADEALDAVDKAQRRLAAGPTGSG